MRVLGGLFVVLLATGSSSLLLSAPFSAFDLNGNLNLTQIPLQAEKHSEWGVDVAWINGGMAQWDQLRVQERKTIAEVWVPAARAKNLFSIIHVGSQCVADAVELAEHASTIRPDAIGVIAPMAPEHPQDIDALVAILARVAKAAGDLPLFYYHLPGVTKLTFLMSDLVIAANKSLPTFAGIKYVDSNVTDFELCRTLNPNLKIFWAPEPKLQVMHLHARDFVLAEGYYAPFLHQVVERYDAGDVSGATKAQEYLNEVQAIVNPLGASKSVMTMLHVPLGPPRLPAMRLSEKVYEQAYDQLLNKGFFNNFTHHL